MRDKIATALLWVSFGLALSAHVLVGLLDEHRLSLRIVGPLSQPSVISGGRRA